MKKGRVLLITPNLKGIADGVNRIQPSLGLMLIAPLLEKSGHNVKIYDAALSGWNNQKMIDEKNKIISIGDSDEDIAKEVSNFAPDVVAISVLFSNLLESAHNIARIVKSGSKPLSNWPFWTSEAPDTTTARPPRPVIVSKSEVWKVRSRKNGRRIVRYVPTFVSNSSPRRFSCWKATISVNPWTVSTACAFRSPKDSRVRDPNASRRLRARTGLRATRAKNGSKARAIGEPVTLSKIITNVGTNRATNAGATVWAKKYSTISTSWVAIPTMSPERRVNR